MFVRPANFQNATKQTQDPPPPLPHSRPVTPQPLPARVAGICVVLFGFAAGAFTSVSAATRLISARTTLIGAPPQAPSDDGARCLDPAIVPPRRTTGHGPAGPRGCDWAGVLPG